MIKINIITKDDKIGVEYNEKDVNLIDVSLVIRELERIKLELLEKEFENDFEYSDDVDRD